MTVVTVAPVRTRPYALLATLQALDVLTTWWILHHWSTRSEANPIAHWVFNSFGLHAGIFMLATVKLSCVYSLYNRQSGVKLITALYSLVIFNNLLFLALWLAS